MKLSMIFCLAIKLIVSHHFNSSKFYHIKGVIYHMFRYLAFFICIFYNIQVLFHVIFLLIYDYHFIYYTWLIYIIAMFLSCLLIFFFLIMFS